MKIVIKSKDGPKHLTIILPISFIKTRLASRIVVRMGDNKNIDKDELHQVLKKAYKSLKEYVKVNGHFDLVDIHSGDGDIIKIRV